jgi:hypothetical protein
LSSFWLILKQQWRIEEIYIFSNSSHLEWRAGLSDTILKGTHLRTIPARFGLIWFRGFRGEDLNVKVYNVRRTPSDGKSSHGLWPGELKRAITPKWEWNFLKNCRVCRSRHAAHFCNLNLTSRTKSIKI